jgi:hypothetical protein
MNEEIEYAEMLEIPVSTVNVVRKNHRKRKQKRAEAIEPQTVRAERNATPLKDTVLAQVNDRLNEATENEQLALDADLFIENATSEGRLDFDPIPERIDTVRLYSGGSADELSPYDYNTNEGGMYATNEPPKAIRIALAVEFGVACALCGAIFLTNVFLPGSAINTFFRALNTPVEDTAKPYSEFTLAAVVSELSDAELTLSPAGVLSLTDDCHIYPVADGKVGEVSKTEDGLYTVKVCYSDSFTGVFSGLNTIYYAEGDTVKTNVPLGYTTGEEEVQVTMYSNGLLLNCFELTEENCLAWISTEESE